SSGTSTFGFSATLATHSETKAFVSPVTGAPHESTRVTLTTSRLAIRSQEMVTTSSSWRDGPATGARPTTSDTDRIDDMPEAKGPCAFAGCPPPVKSRGMCNGHYMQTRRGAELRPVQPRRPGLACSVDGCETPARDHASGEPLCGKHYQRWRRYGDPTRSPK